MIPELYRLARGVLTVRITGSNTQRFLNLGMRAGICFWDIEYLDSTSIRMCMFLSDVYRLRPFGRKTRVRLRIEGRKGLPFFLHRYRARKVYALLIPIVIAAVCLLSARIWRIEINGNSSIGEDVLLEYLKNRDITYGSPKKAVDNNALALSLRQDFDAVIWASVYEKGTKLVVSIQEKIASDPGRIDTEGCNDLVAARDAEIVSIITRAGTPCVKAGDKVKAGDILVCGRQEILDDNGEVREYYYRSADADVMGAVVYDYEDWIPEKENIRQLTGRQQSRWYLTIGSWQIVLPSLHADYDDYESVEEVKQMVLMDSFYLPVHFGRIRQLERRSVALVRSKEEAKELASSHLEQFLSDLEENGVSISDKNVMIEKVDDGYHVYGSVSASESITRTAPTDVPVQRSTEEQ